MLTKVTDTFWIDIEQLDFVGNNSDEVVIYFKSGKNLGLKEKNHEAFYKALNQHYDNLKKYLMK